MNNRNYKWLSITLASAVILGGASSAIANKTLSADEVKKLITGKTVHVTRKHDGKQWKLYFAPDGKGYQTADSAAGTWEIKDNGEHCASWATLKCAKIADLGNSQYARLKPNGDVAVTWTKIEDGKKL